jgi:hypothetical protein
LCPRPHFVPKFSVYPHMVAVQNKAKGLTSGGPYYIIVLIDKYNNAL